MMPGYAKILTCPKCGTKKEVLGLVSGNTIVQTVWSDNKIITPLSQRVSFVQKCPACGHYYLLSRQKPEFSSNKSNEQGELNYIEMKEAWLLLRDMPDLTENEMLSLLIMQVWAFNDEYTRHNGKSAPKEEQAYITKIIDLLLNLDMVDDLLRAELLREAGRFDESLDLLSSYPFKNAYISKCKNYSLTSNKRPFII